MAGTVVVDDLDAHIVRDNDGDELWVYGPINNDGLLRIGVMQANANAGRSVYITKDEAKALISEISKRIGI